MYEHSGLTIANVSGLLAGLVCWANINDIVYFICGILSLLVSIVCGIMKIVKMIKDAKRDGEIDEDEKEAIKKEIGMIGKEITKEIEEINNEGNRRSKD